MPLTISSSEASAAKTTATPHGSLRNLKCAATSGQTSPTADAVLRCFPKASTVGTATAESLDSYDLLEAIARKRGMLLPGGRVNSERAAVMLMDEFRGGVLGRITLERVKE